VQLAMGMLHPAESALGTYKKALIGQDWHDLA
jgi:hypothetical protein